MIRSFRDKTTEAVFNGKCPKGFPAELFSVARRKLRAIDFAAALDDLKSPPGNMLEALKKDRIGQHSVRSMIGFASASSGPMPVWMMSNSPITIKESLRVRPP